LIYKNVYIGEGTINNALLELGPNIFRIYCNVLKNATNELYVSDFISEYLVGNVTSVNLYGLPDSTENPYLKPAFRDIAINVTVPGLEDKLIRYARMELSPLKYIRLIAPIKLHLYNPTNITMTMVGYTIYVYSGTTQIGYVDKHTGVNITIPQFQVIETSEIDASITGLTMDLIEHLLTEFYVDVDGYLDVIIGDGFQTKIHYKQSHIEGELIWSWDESTTTPNQAITTYIA